MATRRRTAEKGSSETKVTSSFNDKLVSENIDIDAEMKFLKLAELKTRLRLQSQHDTEGALNKAVGKAMEPIVGPQTSEEQLCQHILSKLQLISDFDPRWFQISSIFGTNSRLEISRQLASKYVSNSSLSAVMRELVTPEVSDALVLKEKSAGRLDAADPMSTKSRLEAVAAREQAFKA
jgi:hypothetical protein